MTDEPTTRELLIELRALASQMHGLTTRFDGIVQTLATTYVPRGEYVAHRQADDRRFDDIEDDIDKQAGWRRQVTAGAAVGVLLLIIGVILTLAQVPGVGP